MLSILPEQVKMEAAVAEYPSGLPEDSLLTMEGMLRFAWADRILQSIADGWVRVIKDIYAFRQPRAH